MYRPALPSTAALLAACWPGFALAQAAEPAAADEILPATAMAGIAVAVAGGLLILALAVILWLRRRLHDAQARAAALAQGHRWMAQALDGPLSGIVLWPPGARTLTLPPQLAKLLGLPAGDSLGLDRLTFAVSSPDRPMLGTGLERLDQDGTGFDMACRLADGVRTVVFRGDRLPGDGADGPQNRLTIAEVSQVAAAATVIANEKDRLQAALDVMPIPVWLRRTDLSLLYGNAAYARAVDAGREEAIARGLEFTSGADKAGGQAIARRALQSNAAHSEDRHVVVAGDRRLFEITEAPVAGIGSGVHIVGRALDKT
ncbi:MAG TPA: PAS domain-containing protein, partial [Actinomycetes bacterium]|nr:PAS domain-containing protein [Actinomycetes bacterium]